MFFVGQNQNIYLKTQQTHKHKIIDIVHVDISLKNSFSSV